jgi:trypsin
MYKLTIFLFTLAVPNLVLSVPAVTHNVRVIGGNTAQPGQFPFAVSIMMPSFGQNWCGGTIISKNSILTAAQCMNNLFPEDFVVVAGTIDLRIGGTVYNISQVTIHPTFNETNLIDDIAVVKVDGEFEISESVQIAEIGEVVDNDTCTVSGWGATENINAPASLMFANLRALSVEECDKLAEDGVFDVERGPGQVCGFGGRGNGVCYGDAGDSLTSKGKFVGIASYAVAQCAVGWPDLYTRVAYYKDWINTII